MVPSRLERLILERDFQIDGFRKKVSNYEDRGDDLKDTSNVEENIISGNLRLFRKILKRKRKKKKKLVRDRNGRTLAP